MTVADGPQRVFGRLAPRRGCARVGLAAMLTMAAATAALGTAQLPVGAAPRIPSTPANSATCVRARDAAAGDAVVVNITNTDVLGVGWGALRAPRTTPVFQRNKADRYANVNFAPATPPNPNVGIVKVGPNSTFCYDGAVDAHNVILDQLAVIPAANADVQNPSRVLDTRRLSRVGANSSVCVRAPGAKAGDAVMVNITNTDVSGDGWGALRASGTAPVYQRPAQQRYANVNFAAATPPNPNVGIVKVDANSTFCYDGAEAAHNVILDQLAVIPAANADVQNPSRVLDTRRLSRVGANSSVCVRAPGAKAGDAVMVNITNTDVSGDGWGALRASGTAPVYQRPAQQRYANVNFAAATPPNPNVGIVKVGADSTFCYDGAEAAHNVILDQLAVIPAAKVNVQNPTRLIDTRRNEVDPTARIPANVASNVWALDCGTDSNCVALGSSPDSSAPKALSLWSSDGGQTWGWTTLPFTVREVSSLGNIECVSAKRCLFGYNFGGRDFITVTADGGRTWKTTFVDPDSNVDTDALASISCSGTNCYASNYYGQKILRSTDQGETWNEAAGTAAEDGFGDHVCFSARSCLVTEPVFEAVNENISQWESTRILRTNDGFDTTQRIAEVPAAILNFECPGGDVCYGVGFSSENLVGTLYRSQDRGATWTQLEVPIINGLSLIEAFSCASAKKCAFATVEPWRTAGDQRRLSIFVTTDGGITWRRKAHLDGVGGAPDPSTYRRHASAMSCNEAGRCLVAGETTSGYIVEISGAWN